jgi:hypothetical protein
MSTSPSQTTPASSPQTAVAPSQHKPPVFLIGTPRSGTTLLHQMLDHHPAFALPYESKYIPTFRANIAQFGDLNDPKNREALIIGIERFMCHAWMERVHEEWIPGLAAAAPELAKTAQPSLAGCIDAIYNFFAKQRKARRWGDKMATFKRAMPIVLELFPDAKIIHLIRDGRDVASSLLPLSFGPNTAYVAAKKWRNAVEDGMQFAEKHPDKVYTVRYEDLVDDPEKYLREICDFLGEPFKEEMLHFYHTGTARVPRREIHGQLNKPVNKERAARWKKDLSPHQVRVFEAVAGPLLAKLGYEVVNPGAKVSPLDRGLGNLGNKVLWWRPFTHPVGLWDKVKMSVLRRQLKQE